MRLSRNKDGGQEAETGGASDRLKAFLRARGLRMTGEREALVRAAIEREVTRAPTVGIPIVAAASAASACH